MKVLLTSDLNPTSVNGVIVSVLLLKRELERKGFEVRLLTLSPTVRSYVEKDVYYVSSVPLKIYPDLRASLDWHSHLIDELMEWGPDLIHSQCEFFTYSFVQRIARRCRCPIVHTYHTQYEYYTNYVLPGNWNRLLSEVMRRRLETADVVIAPTEKTRRYLVREGIKGDVRIIPTGIDLDAFRHPASAEELVKMRRDLKIPEHWMLYGSIGRIAREKNLSEVLRAHQMLRKSREDVGLLLVGDGAGMEDIRREVHALGLERSVFFTGMVPKESVGAYYRLLDVFVSASVSETQGLTYIEALANGRPVVARRDGAIEDVVVDGENGFQFDTTEECAHDVLQLLNDEALRSRMAKGAVEKAECFGKERFADRVASLYREVLNRGNHPAARSVWFSARIKERLAQNTEQSDTGRVLNEWKMRRQKYRFEQERRKKR